MPVEGARRGRPSSSSPSATSSATTSETAGVNGAVELLPAPCACAPSRSRSAAASRCATLLPRATRRRRRSRGRAASSAPSASRRRRRRGPSRPSPAARRRGSRRRRRRRARRPPCATAASAWTSATTPVEVSEWTRKTSETGSSSRELAREVVGRRRLAPGVAELLDLAAEVARHRRPALAEVAGGDGEHAVARRAEVDDRRLERARARAREEEDVVVGAVHLLQAAEHARVDLPEVGRAVVEHRLGERGEHLRRHRRRPGREQVALLRHRPEPSGAPGRATTLPPDGSTPRVRRRAGRAAARRPARRALAAAPAAAARRSGARASPPTRSAPPRSPGARRAAGTTASSAPTTSSAACSRRRCSAPARCAGAGVRAAIPVVLVYAGLAAGVALAVPLEAPFAGHVDPGSAGAPGALPGPHPRDRSATSPGRSRSSGSPSPGSAGGRSATRSCWPASRSQPPAARWRGSARPRRQPSSPLQPVFCTLAPLRARDNSYLLQTTRLLA